MQLAGAATPYPKTVTEESTDRSVDNVCRFLDNRADPSAHRFYEPSMGKDRWEERHVSDKPALRQLYDRVADELGPELSNLTASDRFAEVVGVVDVVRNRAASELQRRSRRMLHARNLPAGTDIAVLRQEIGALDRTVRGLTRQVEALQRPLADASTSPTPTTGRSRTRAS